MYKQKKFVLIMILVACGACVYFSLIRIWKSYMGLYSFYCIFWKNVQLYVDLLIWSWYPKLPDTHPNLGRVGCFLGSSSVFRVKDIQILDSLRNLEIKEVSFNNIFSYRERLYILFFNIILEILLGMFMN